MLKFRTTKEALDETRFSTHAFHSLAEFAAQMQDIEATHVAQLNPFKVGPEAFTRMQFRGVGRQALQVQPLGGAVRKEPLDSVAAVDRRAIPDNQQTAGHFAQQMLETRHDGLRVDGVVLGVEVQPALRRQRADGGAMIARLPLPQDGGLPHRGVAAHHTRQGIETRFVYQEDGLLLGLRPFLRAGQVVSRQCAIAASSRCRARRAGFWRLQRIAWHTRPIWVRW